MNRRVRIIGVASGAGASDPGCRHGPPAYHHSRAFAAIAHHPEMDWSEVLYPPDEGTPVGRIAHLCRRLADEVGRTMAAGEFPVVVGGDHSVAIGTWSGVARYLGAPVGLLWVDAHMDSHTPSTSYTGAIHGMPLACLLGRGPRPLLDLGLRGPQVDPDHTVLFGCRSYEPEEAAFLARMRVGVADREAIAGQGIAATLHEALRRVSDAPSGFGISIDLDAFDPAVAPGVGTPEPDGLRPAEMLRTLAGLAGDRRLKCLEIVEYNPDRDREGFTGRLLTELVRAVLPVRGAAAAEPT